MQDEDIVELDGNGTPIIPNEIYEEAYEKECNDWWAYMKLVYDKF